MTTYPFHDTTDFEAADRGLIGPLSPRWSRRPTAGSCGTTTPRLPGGECPDTAQPEPVAAGQLSAKQGLFEVTDGIYQVRGLDLSNMTLVEGDTGVIVIDPLISPRRRPPRSRCTGSTAATGRSPAVIYTHAHVDHFGGVQGVDRRGHACRSWRRPASWNTPSPRTSTPGGAMRRRASLHVRRRAADGPGRPGRRRARPDHLDRHLALIPPTLDITHTGQEETLDGVRIVFQLTPGTEAPAEMNFLFPDRRALCLAENATHNLHNLLTLRGAQVRDPRIWSRYLNEAIDLFADDTDVAFASHHWPTWGTRQHRHVPVASSATSTPTCTTRPCG